MPLERRSEKTLKAKPITILDLAQQQSFQLAAVKEELVEFSEKELKKLERVIFKRAARKKVVESSSSESEKEAKILGLIPLRRDIEEQGIEIEDTQHKAQRPLQKAQNR